MKVFILRWLMGWAGLFESIIFIVTFGFVALHWKLYMAKCYSKARFLPNNQSSRPDKTEADLKGPCYVCGHAHEGEHCTISSG